MNARAEGVGDNELAKTALPLGPDVRIVARDANGVIAFNKPVGVLSHPNVRGDAPRSLLKSGYEMNGEYYHWTVGDGAAGERRLWLLNRLDVGTSGVILGATDEALASTIRAHFREKQVRKVYHALVFGVPAQATQVWRDRLAVDKRGGHIRTTTGGNIPAETAMRVLRQNRRVLPPLVLLELTPRTGRSHQLRVQCAHRSLPIVGDGTYGDFRANRAFSKQAGVKRMYLHSHATAFDYDWVGRRWSFSAVAETPAEFLAAL